MTVFLIWNLKNSQYIFYENNKRLIFYNKKIQRYNKLVKIHFVIVFLTKINMLNIHLKIHLNESITTIYISINRTTKTLTILKINSWDISSFLDLLDFAQASRNKILKFFSHYRHIKVFEIPRTMHRLDNFVEIDHHVLKKLSSRAILRLLLFYNRLAWNPF